MTNQLTVPTDLPQDAIDKIRGIIDDCKPKLPVMVRVGDIVGQKENGVDGGRYLVASVGYRRAGLVNVRTGRTWNNDLRANTDLCDSIDLTVLTGREDSEFFRAGRAEDILG